MTDEVDHEKSAPDRIRVWLTREGGIYLIVLLFIATGALLRNINLLILLTGIMVAPILIGWRISLTMLKRLRLKRTLPRVAFAQQPFEVNWEIKNERPTLSTWQLVVRDQCQRQIPTASAQRPEVVRLLFPVVRPEESVFQTYRSMIATRGEYQFGPVTIRTRFPFGLLQAICDVGHKESIFIAPPHGDLTTSWDRRLLSKASGTSAVKRKRQLVDDEFFALRTWRSGDSLKQIHWRTTAKYGQPMVKQFDSRTDKDFVLILDLFLPPGTGTASLHELRLERVLSFASTLFSRIQGHVFGQISVAVCGADQHVHSNNVYSRIAFDVFQSLALAQGSSEPLTVKALLDVGTRVSQGTPIYVFSTRPFSDSLLGGLSASEKVRYRSLEQWIRWVEVSSAEFREIFQPPDILRDSLSGESATSVPGSTPSPSVPEVRR